jgi:hypothetical protein
MTFPKLSTSSNLLLLLVGFPCSILRPKSQVMVVVVVMVYVTKRQLKVGKGDDKEGKREVRG